MVLVELLLVVVFVELDVVVLLLCVLVGKWIVVVCDVVFLFIYLVNFVLLGVFGV